MKQFERKFVARLALAATLGVGVTLSSLSLASGASRPDNGRTGSAHSSTIQFSGQVSAYSAASGTTSGSITLTDRAGATLTFTTSVATTITQIGGSGSALAINDFATIQAAVIAPRDASSITFSAAAPVSFSGIVTAYTAPSSSADGSVTLVKRNDASLTYSVTPGTVITENGGGNSAIAIDDFARPRPPHRLWRSRSPLTQHHRDRCTSLVGSRPTALPREPPMDRSPFAVATARR